MNLSSILKLPGALSKFSKEIIWEAVAQFMRSHSAEVSPMSLATLWCGVKHLERKNWVLLGEVTDLVSALNWQARNLAERGEKFKDAAEKLACRLDNLGGVSPAHPALTSLQLSRALAAQSFRRSIQCRAVAACLSGLAQAAISEGEDWED